MVNGRRVRLPEGIKPGDTYHLSGDLGKKYPDGVKFDKEGFLDFSPYSQKNVKINMTGDTQKDFDSANASAGFKQTPDGMTWHHNQDGETMQLVPSDLNKNVAHTGGAAVARSARAIAADMGMEVADAVAPATTQAVENKASATQIAGAAIKDSLDNTGIGTAAKLPVEAGKAMAAGANTFVNNINSGDPSRVNQSAPLQSSLNKRAAELNEANAAIDATQH